jgi:hypothetical protein
MEWSWGGNSQQINNRKVDCYFAPQTVFSRQETSNLLIFTQNATIIANNFNQIPQQT